MTPWTLEEYMVVWYLALVFLYGGLEWCCRDWGCDEPVDWSPFVKVGTAKEWGSQGETFLGMSELPVSEQHHVVVQIGSDLG